MVENPHLTGTLHGHEVLVLGAAGLTVIATGAASDALWLLGVGVWGVIAAMLIELVYQP